LQDLKLEIAHHPNTPTPILEKLTQYKAPKVTLSHLRYQLYSTSKYVSQAAQANYRCKYGGIVRKPDTPITQIQKMVKHRDSWVRVIATENSQGLILLLATYLQEKESWARFLTIIHPNLSIATLQEIATLPLWHDRYAITQNPNTPTEILQQLAQDTEPVVRNAAKVALGLEVSAETPIVQAEIVQAPEQVEPVAIAPKAEASAVTEKLEIVRSLNLTPEDWLWATWVPLNPKPRSPVQPFDLEQCAKRLKRIPCTTRGYFDVQWDKANLPVLMTPEEANFWLSAMMCNLSSTKSKDTRFGQTDRTDLASYLQSLNFSTVPDLHQICVLLLRDYRKIRPQIVLPLFNLFNFAEFCIAIANFQQLSPDEAVQYLSTHLEESYIEEYVTARHWLTREDSLNALAHVMQQESRYLFMMLIHGFRDHLWPYLSDQEIQLLVDQLRPVLKSLPTSLPLYTLAAYFGMEDVRTYLNNWQASGQNRYVSAVEAIEIIFGAGDAHLVESYARSLNIGFGKPEYIKGWLANTQFGALDWICCSILRAHPKLAEPLLQTFAESVQAPEAAPYMLELWLKLKKPQLARQWLEDNPTHAVVGLTPIAAGQNVSPIEAKPTELTKAAIAFLASMKRKGYESLIRSALEQQPSEIAEKVKALVLDQEDTNRLPFDEKTTPQWLKDGIVDLPSQKRSQHPDWVSASDLPALAVGDRCLSEEQIHACLCALKLSTLDSPFLLVRHLKTHASPQSLDSFIWALFERWLTEGGSSKEKWAMLALGLLGSDTIALKLTPLIRNWPGENQHPRAVLGLECLRTIGSDTALMQINGIAQKTKYQGLQARAEECMEAIARDRQLTQDQLEDRIIPDCGLDAAGKRVFDFGSRQFHFALGADLKPLVQDEKGKRLTTLPKPNAKDDAEKAQQAIADWKLLKKQVGEIVKIQNVRLEDAMITERRWPWAEFSTLLVQHPLLNHLVQRLIWGIHSPEGLLTQTFRVSEDRTYADCNDNAFIPDELNSVGIIHPIDLSEDLKAQWGQTLNDYEIIPPFPQTNREVYRLHSEEIEAEEILRFKDILIPGEMLAYTMEKFGWQRGGLHDHGDYQVHYKDFDQGKVTAIVGDYECQHVEKSSIWGADAIDGCLFLVDVIREPSAYPAPGSWDERQMKAKRLRLGEVHPLVISEVLRDLTAIATAAQTP
jgi:Domain of unknown function (DUF4132)